MLMCSTAGVVGGDKWQFRIPPRGDADKAMRNGNCTSGLVNPADGKKVITNGSTLVVYAGNQGQDEAAFTAKLTGAGLPGLSVEDYC